jgi:hypothetical protein
MLHICDTLTHSRSAIDAERFHIEMRIDSIACPYNAENVSTKRMNDTSMIDYSYIQNQQFITRVSLRVVMALGAHTQ